MHKLVDLDERSLFLLQQKKEYINLSNNSSSVSCISFLCQHINIFKGSQANSADSEQTTRNAASDLSIHCLH